MAHLFLVLGGIAIGLVTAGVGVVTIPGWVASAQDASAVNDPSNVKGAQSATASSIGSYATSAELASIDGL
ncbi:hypothetical protein MMX123_02026 [Microbacterium sp. MM2322]|uniref:hypothetical protein n=1 Tax=Microbacterium sp. MM2322 TaxID=3157631 RepID=UPI003D8059F0